MWKLAGSYSMMEASCSGDRLGGNAALPWVEGWALPAGMPERMCGKKVVEATGNDLRQSPPRKTDMLKYCACDTMMGGRRISVGWNQDSKGSKALGMQGWPLLIEGLQ